jgi:NitT/TauT family transport system permease protein
VPEPPRRPRARALDSAAGRGVGAVLAAAAPWAAVVLVWELAARRGWLSTVLFPPPTMSVQWSILASCLRVIVGLALGFGAALVVGVLVSMSRVASRLALPLVRGLAPIAPIAWIPLGIVLFGLGNPTAVFIVFVGVFFTLTIATVAAVASVDPRLVKTARTLGAPPAQIWLRVIFPAIVPQVFTMLRLNFFGAWMGVLAAEMVGLRNGLGALIIMGREMFNANLILLGMALIGASGYAVDSLLVLVQRRVLWWRPESAAR